MFFSVSLAILFSLLFWWNKEVYVTEGAIAEVCPDNIKAAIFKMGPGYDYRVLPDGRLQVNKGDGKWLNLRYERRMK